MRMTDALSSQVFEVQRTDELDFRHCEFFVPGETRAIVTARCRASSGLWEITSHRFGEFELATRLAIQLNELTSQGMENVPDPGIVKINFNPDTPKTDHELLLVWKDAAEKFAEYVGYYIRTGDFRWMQRAMTEKFRLTDAFRRGTHMLSAVVSGAGFSPETLEKARELAVLR